MVYDLLDMAAVGVAGACLGSALTLAYFGPKFRAMRDECDGLTVKFTNLSAALREGSNHLDHSRAVVMAVSEQRDALMREREVLQEQLATALKNNVRDAKGRFTKSNVVPFGSAFGQSTGEQGH